MDSFYVYIAALILIIVVFLIVRKITSCLVKSIIGLVVLAIAAYIYFSMCT